MEEVQVMEACTLRELARRAGVDVSTVSRALNGSPLVKEGRAKDIRELAESLGYRPKPIRTKRTGAIGLIISSAVQGRLDDDFQQRVAGAVQRRLGLKGFHVNMEGVERGPAAVLPELVRQNRVDGVILSGHPNADLVARIRETGLPVVALADSGERLGVPCVTSNSCKAVTQAVTTLAAKGHVRFATLDSDLNYVSIKLRRQAFLDALSALGIANDEKLNVAGLSPNIAGGREGVRELRRRGAAPTAIICGNDWMALGAMAELQRQGVVIPEEMVVLGHDDMPFCEDLEPKLSSVSFDLETLVSKAVENLIRQLAGERMPPVDLVVESQVVWRESVGLAPGRIQSSTMRDAT